MSYNVPNHDPKYVEYQPLYEKKLNQLLGFNGPYKNESLLNFMTYKTFKAVNKDDQHIVHGHYYQVDYNKEDPVDPENRPAWKPLIKKSTRESCGRKYTPTNHLDLHGPPLGSR